MRQVKLQLAHCLPVGIAVFPVEEIQQFIPVFFNYQGVIQPLSEIPLAEGVHTQLGKAAQQVSRNPVRIDPGAVIEAAGNLVDYGFHNHQALVQVLKTSINNVPVGLIAFLEVVRVEIFEIIVHGLITGKNLVWLSHILRQLCRHLDIGRFRRQFVVDH